ncbi:MAG: hypothetical protein ACFFAU_13040 [Candidatus Hodarchaeota archaeon]
MSSSVGYTTFHIQYFIEKKGKDIPNQLPPRANLIAAEREEKNHYKGDA